MEEVAVLIAKSQQGDKAAREVLIEKNLGLVHAIVRRFLGRGVEQEDLFQIGAIGLMKAIDHFDLTYDVKFSTYAVPLISGEIKRFLRDDGPVKVSRTIKEQATAIKSMRSQLTSALGREPTLQEISRQTGFTPEEIALAENATASVESIHREFGQEGFSLENILADDQSEEKLMERIALQQALEKLTEREATVIKLRYYHSLTQDRVAKVLGVSQVQVSRIEKKALQNLRVHLGQ